jgi:hypothetical protein
VNYRAVVGYWITAVTFIALPSFGFAQGESSLWRDPSPHTAQFVTVDDGVQLEVLDWGGTGRNIVFLAGSGNTAHVFDDFAQKLSLSSHVYGITLPATPNSDTTINVWPMTFFEYSMRVIS